MKILVAIESVDVRTGVFFGTSLYAGVPAAGTGANMELCRAGIDLRTARGCAPTASCFGMTILRSLHEPYTPWTHGSVALPFADVVPLQNWTNL